MGVGRATRASPLDPPLILVGASQDRPLYGVPRGPLSTRKLGERERDEDGFYPCSQIF